MFARYYNVHSICPPVSHATREVSRTTGRSVRPQRLWIIKPESSVPNCNVHLLARAAQIVRRRRRISNALLVVNIIYHIMRGSTLKLSIGERPSILSVFNDTCRTGPIMHIRVRGTHRVGTRRDVVTVRIGNVLRIQCHYYNDTGIKVINNRLIAQSTHDITVFRRCNIISVIRAQYAGTRRRGSRSNGRVVSLFREGFVY